MCDEHYKTAATCSSTNVCQVVFLLFLRKYSKFTSAPFDSIATRDRVAYRLLVVVFGHLSAYLPGLAGDGAVLWKTNANQIRKKYEEKRRALGAERQKYFLPPRSAAFLSLSAEFVPWKLRYLFRQVSVETSHSPQTDGTVRAVLLG